MSKTETQLKTTPASAPSPGSAAAEAIRGLCAARYQAAEHRARLLDKGMWMRYDEHWKRFTDEIAALDARIDALMRESPNEKLRHGGENL